VPPLVIDDVENFIHDIETKNVIVTDKADTVMAYETGKGILGRSTKKEIANLNVKYDSEKKQQQILLE